jgi:hypothetical protein
MITTLLTVSKPAAARRVTFHDDQSLQKEEERSKRGQVRRWIRKDVKKKLKKKMAESSAAVVGVGGGGQRYTEEQRQGLMKDGFPRLTSSWDTLLRLFNSVTIEQVRGWLQVENNRLDWDSVESYKLVLELVLRAAGAGESLSMEEKLAWFREKNMSYDFFIQRNGATRYLWLLCRSTPFQAAFYYDGAASSSEDGEHDGLAPAAIKTILRGKLDDGAHAGVNMFLVVANSQSTETAGKDLSDYVRKEGLKRSAEETAGSQGKEKGGREEEEDQQGPSQKKPKGASG